MTAPFIAEIKMFGGNFAPRNYANCDGALLAINQNTALFSLLGTTYGGNGTTTFQLPNLQGRVPIHRGQSQGTSPYVLGEVGGVEDTTLLSTNLPSHSHPLTIAASTGGGTSGTPGPTTVLASSTARDRMYSTAAPDTTVIGGNSGLSGGNQPFSVVQPYLVVTFIIALQGIFPARN